MKRSRAPSMLKSRKVAKISPLHTPHTKPVVDKKEPVVSDSKENITKNPTTTTISKPPLRRKRFTAPTVRKITPANTTNTNEKTEELFLVYEVFWTKRSNKKHKNYADGILVIKNRTCILKDMEGKDLGKTNYPIKELTTLKEGNTLDVGAKELEIVKLLPTETFTSGRIFTCEVKPVDVKPTITRKPPSKIRSVKSIKKTALPVSRYDPNTEGAVVLYNAEGECDKNGTPHCSVVVDPFIGKYLRPHQVEGIKFLFESCSGLRNDGWNGCILADAMGLGKTLQSITLLYTLLQQSIYGGPTIKKGLIVCPSSLVDNWKKEINRWLGVRIKPLCIGGDSNKKEVQSTIVSFTQGSKNNCLIISYGYFKRNVKALQKASIELILCDEGHKLKNGNSQITKALHSMPSKRRVILSGTPIQNDLQEFFYIMDVVNPGIMGNLTAFKRVYEKPIIASRERNCKPSAREEGDARAKELSRRCNMFILRRNANILIPYLPPKVEQVIFCRLSDVQVKLYNYFLKSRGFMYEIMESPSFAFACIQLIGKLCNHPSLIYEKCKSDFPDALPLFGDNFNPDICQPEYSGKFQALDRLLSIVKTADSSNKVVVVSNYTKTLDVLEKLFKKNNYLCLRLDGSTDSSKRMHLVDKFNSKHSNEFIFLLSSKAGGVGLNLIGGNRLVLVDPDWNPATDEQAMARIWREGQPKPVWIYRLICTGTLEEKIYQRQMRKQAISRSIVDDSIGEKRNFTSDELKRIFDLTLDTISETHELLGCTCFGINKKKPIKRQIQQQSSEKLLGDNWQHFNDLSTCYDPMLKLVENNFTSNTYANNQLISCVFASSTKDLSDIPQIKDKTIKEDDKEYLGYEKEDFKKIDIKLVDNKEEEEDNIVEDNIEEEEDNIEEDDIVEGTIEEDNIEEDEEDEFIPKKRLSRKVKVESIINENDEDMEYLLNFDSDSNE